MDSLAIRRSAIVLSAMQPSVRLGVLRALDAQTRAQVETALCHVLEKEWNTRAHALSALASAAEGAQETGQADVPGVFSLAGQLDVQSFSRVLQASGIQHDDFLLTLLDPELSRQVRAELAVAAPMPAAVSTATLVAVEHLIAPRQDEVVHASA